MTVYSTQLIPKRDWGFNGTGRRAAYALLSDNTSTPATVSIAFYDENFRSVSGLRAMQGYSQGNADIATISYTATYGGRETLFSLQAGSQNQVSSNGTSNFPNGTNSCGEFSNSMADIFSDGNFQGVQNRSTSQTEKFYLNQNAIMSDHTDKSTVYTLTSGKIRAVSRLFGQYGYSKAGTADFTVLNLNASMTGTACYHANRKELTILSYKNSTTFDVFTYNNVDFNAFPSPAVALSQSNVTLTASTVNITDVNTSYIESMYRVMPTVSDDGTVWVTTFVPSAALKLSKFTRSGTTAATATPITSLSVTTSYGVDNGVYYGQRRMQSRDGTTIACFCPYYYYGAGIECFIIDKTNNTYQNFNWNNTSDGCAVLPFKDTGWAFYTNSNFYASNWSGAFIMATFERGDSLNTQLRQSSAGKYLPYVTTPNTTNYPALMPVVDYSMMIRDTNGELIQPYGDAF